MLLKHQKIINKIRYLLKIEAWTELNKPKYKKYLNARFSCHGCRYNRAKNPKKDAAICDMYSGTKILFDGGVYWCFKWVEPGNWIYIK